jgi:hypothetical protein
MVPLKTVGLMSGTGFDGVDAALLETDGITLSHTGPSLYRPYSGPNAPCYGRRSPRSPRSPTEGRGWGASPKPISW